MSSSPLSKVSAASDSRDLKIEPARIKGTPFLLDAGATANRTKSDFFSLA